jgi:hypothetical protein
MKNKINTIINSWPMRHKHLILTLSLVAALIAPVAHHTIIQFIPTSYANYEKEHPAVNTSTLERTREIHDQMLMTAYYQALDEEYKKIGRQIDIPEEEVRQMLQAINK